MKLAVLQFDPKFKQVQHNIDTVNGILSRYQVGDMDKLILPEMALTGYMFQGRDEFCHLWRLEPQDQPLTGHSQHPTDYNVM